MATTTPQMVKELRELTGAGMGDCKKALDQAGGDSEKAVVFLRERGLAAAQKKSDRAASEGVVNVSLAKDCDRGFVFEVNCETDFVTRNEEFQKFVSGLSDLILSSKINSLDQLLNTPFTAGTVKETATGLVAKIGENIMVRRFATLGSDTSYVCSYIHGKGRIGVLVELAGDNIRSQASNPDLAAAAKNVALQVAAMKPVFVHRSNVAADVIEKEKEIFFNQYRNQGKPEAALPKIVTNRMETWFKESCLSEQLFFVDETKTVGTMLLETGKKLGVANLRVINFSRLELGEGVEKKSVDFATEVASQIADAKK